MPPEMGQGDAAALTQEGEERRRRLRRQGIGLAGPGYHPLAATTGTGALDAHDDRRERQIRPAWWRCDLYACWQVANDQPIVGGLAVVALRLAAIVDVRELHDQERLLVDVEEARASFSIVAPGRRPDLVHRAPCASQHDLVGSLKAVIDELEADLCAAAFAAPGPVVSGTIQLTHVSMRLEQALLQDALGVPLVRLVNDFSARAMAMPLLEEASLQQFGGRRLPGQAPAAALGPSGGLGVSILNPDGFVGWVASTGEGGHACLPAISRRQSDVIEQLRRRDPHVSADWVLSDRGLLEVASAVGVLDDAQGAAATVTELMTAAKAGDAVAREAFQLFAEWLGVVAGDLALTAGARSGVYVFSPMILAWGEHFDQDRCRACFEAKGRMSSYVADVPLFFIVEQNCGLLSLSTLFDAAETT